MKLEMKVGFSTIKRKSRERVKYSLQLKCFTGRQNECRFTDHFPIFLRKGVVPR